VFLDGKERSAFDILILATEYIIGIYELSLLHAPFGIVLAPCLWSFLLQHATLQQLSTSRRRGVYISLPCKLIHAGGKKFFQNLRVEQYRMLPPE
jgi:hypothetical protein